MAQPEYLLGIHNFKGRSEDELDITRGDYIEVLEDDSAFNDTWYIGRNLRTYATGLFPKPFTTSVATLPPDVALLAAQAPPIVGLDELEPGNNDADNNQPLASEAATADPHQPSSHNIQLSNAPPNGGSHQPPASGLNGGVAEGISSLSIQDESPSPVTEPSMTTASGPNSATSGDNSLDAAYRKHPLYHQPPDSHQSEIDRAISAMQSSPDSARYHQEPLQAPLQPPFSQSPVGKTPSTQQPAPLQPGSQAQLQPGQINPVSQLSRHSSTQGSVHGSQPSSLLGTPVATSAGPNPAAVLHWTPQHVEAYFSSKGLAEDAPKFVNHRITGAILLEMDRETLKEIDIVSFGPRFEIEREIRALRQLVGFSPASSHSPQSPHSTTGGLLNTALLNSPMGGTSMSSLMNTPVAAQQGYFGYPEYGQSHLTLNPSRQPSQSSQTSASGGYSQAPAQPLHLQTKFPQQLRSPVAVPQPNQVYAQQGGQGQPQQGSQGQPQQGSQGQPQQGSQGQPQPFSQFPLSQPRALQSEEEVTGSLNSSFSMRQPTAVAAAQVAATRGHHRHTSSATSRYSVTGGHQRTRTIDDWESGLQPALMENQSGSSLALHHPPSSNSAANTAPASSGSGTSGSSHPDTPGPGHIRSVSRGSAFSASRNATAAERGHNRTVSADSKKHRRRSSVLSLLSSSPKKAGPGPDSPTKRDVSSNGSSASHQSGSTNSQIISNSSNSHSGSAGGAGALKSMIRPGLTKQKTSAFQEGIQHTTAEKATQSADKAGWLHKRGGSGLGVWSKRYFTLHGTRLSYFSNFKDTKERGLIDITGHRVVPIKDNDLLVSLSAAGMGAGRYCFKLVPPGPGYKKGVAFTAPKVHYFAAESEEEMREWQTQLLTATIERDESAPVTSTCKLPTMSLPKAQELMAERLKTKGDIGSLIN